ncbi:MAG: GNAT family acetyltransferase [Spirochaetales bacterium]|nr:GNAT family acetyltransferase [Spirochaetales bacterium]
MTSGFSIRIYNASDQAEVIALWKQSKLLVAWNDPAIDIERKTDFQPELFFVATLSGKIVGTVMAGYEGHRGWINFLCVAPDLRFKGYGKRLMLHAEEELKKLGCLKINLQVRSSNKGVAAFYERIGFSRDDVIPFGKRLK